VSLFHLKGVEEMNFLSCKPGVLIRSNQLCE